MSKYRYTITFDCDEANFTSMSLVDAISTAICEETKRKMNAELHYEKEVDVVSQRWDELRRGIRIDW